MLKVKCGSYSYRIQYVYRGVTSMSTLMHETSEDSFVRRTNIGLQIMNIPGSYPTASTLNKPLNPLVPAIDGISEASMEEPRTTTIWGFSS